MADEAGTVRIQETWTLERIRDGQVVDTVQLGEREHTLIDEQREAE